MNVIDLFSGIGGFSLAADSVGFTTIAFCEMEPYATQVLNRHWPDVPVFPDVKELTSERLGITSPRLDVVEGVAEVAELEPMVNPSSPAMRCGVSTSGRKLEPRRDVGLILTAGFPCQDISYAGKGAGLQGERSGLFYEVARLADELRPDYLLLENVAALLTRGLDAVLGTLASLGYDACWACVPACAVGAPHRRDRVWIVAVPQSPDSEKRLTAIYEHVLAGLTPFGDERWTTPIANKAEKRGNHNEGLRGQAARGERWPTPSANEDAAGTPAGQMQSMLGNHPAVRGDNPEQWATGALNPAWVEPLMGYPIGYTLPEGEPLRELPGVWPETSPDGRGWMTPKSGDAVFASGSTSGRSREMSTHLPTQVKLTGRWPAGLGAPQHEWEPPRLTKEKAHRAKRLKCLGNSIVPQVARLWMEAIARDAT